MDPERKSRRLIVGLLCAMAGAFVAGVVLVLRTGDAHWMNRSGAFISALAAAAILFQVLVEISIEHKVSAGAIAKSRLPHEADLIDPLDKIEGRIKMARIEENQRLLTNARLRVVMTVISCAILGELMHGFGDLLACAVLSCTAHP